MLFLLLLFFIFASGTTAFAFFLYYKKTQKLTLTYNIKIAQTLGHAATLRDHETGAHNFRVAYMSSIIGEALHLKKEALQALMKGAFLHDIGKIGISDLILLKKGSFDEREWKIMKKHPALGVQLIEDITWFDDAKDVILYHHERFDGTGYPEELKGYYIPLNARIFAIIDVFDALLATRPYKKAFSYEKTIAMMRENSRTHFDPEILEHFFLYAPEFAKIIEENDTDTMKKRLEQRRKKIFGI